MSHLPALKRMVKDLPYIIALMSLFSTVAAMDICNEETMEPRKKYYYDSSIKAKDLAVACYITGNDRGNEPGHGVIRFSSKDQQACKITNEEYRSTYDKNWKIISQTYTEIDNTACISADGEYLLRTGEYNDAVNFSSTLEYKAENRPERYKITYSSIPSNLQWLPSKKSSLKLVKSANSARTIPIDWKGFNLYGNPKIKSIILQGVIIADLETFPVTTDKNITTITASSNDKLNTSGEMEIVIINDYNEMASIFVDVSFFTFKDDPSVLSLKMELSLARKLIADEFFLRAGDVQPSKICSEKTMGAVNGKTGNTEVCEIKDQYLLAEKVLPDCGTKGQGVDCSALTEAQLATLKLIRSDIAYRLILLENGVPFLGGYRSLKQTTPHQELIKLQALEQRMSELIDKIRDVQWRTTDVEIKGAETEAGRAYSMGQAKSQEITSTISEIESVNFDAEIARNRQHLESLAAHISDLGERAEDIEKQQEALEARAGSLIHQGIAAASGLPVQEVETLASGDIETAVKSYVIGEVSKQGSELAKKFADNNEMVKTVSKAYEDFKKAENEIRTTVDDVTKIPGAIEAAREKLDRDLQHANTAITELRDDIGGSILKGFAGSAGKEIRKEVEQMVEELKPLGLRIEAAHKKMMEEGYPEKMRKSFEDGLYVIASNVNLSRQEWNSIRESLVDDIHAGLMDHEKRFLVSRLVQIIKGEVKDSKKGLVYLQGLFTLYPELINGVDGKFLERLLKLYKGNINERNTVYALRKAIINGIEEYNGDYSRGPHVFYNTQEKSLVFRIGLNERREDSYAKISIENLAKPIVSDFDEIQTKLPSEQKIEAFFRIAQNEFADRHLFLIKNSMKGPEEFARQMQVTVRSNAQDLQKAWDKLNENKNSIFNTAEVIQAPRDAITTLLAMQSFESMQVTLPPTKKPTQMQSEELSDNGISPEANMALGAALNYAFPGAGVALQLGQTYASMDANNDLLEEIEKETVRALAEYQQTQKAISKATIDSAIAKKEQDRAEALAEAADAQLRQFDVVMQIALNEKMELRALLAMYRPYFFYLSEMMRERFNAFDRSLAIWAYGKPSQGFFAKKIMEDPRNVRLALDSEIHLFDWLNREREATKTDPYYLFNHWQQIITLAETYCADYGCKPGDSKLGKIAATVPVGLITDLGGVSLKKSFKEWKSLDDRSHSFIFPINLNGMENLIPRDFLNVRLIDINIVPITKSGEFLRGNMVNVKHTGAARITTLDRATGMLTVFEENLLPSKNMPPSNQYPFNLTELAERFQSQTDLNSLLALRGFEGYGALGSYEFSVLNSRDIENVEDFEIQLAYVYQEATDIMSEQDYFNMVNAPCAKNETRDELDVTTNKKEQNVFDVGTEVITCTPKMQVQFKAFSIDSKTGDVTCKSGNSIRLDISDINHMPVVRSILGNNDRSGFLSCATFTQTFLSSSEKIYDLSGLAASRPKCTLVEIMNAAGNNSARKSKCFGEAL